MDCWPDALRLGLNLLLPSQAQMVLFWRPELTTFYNDAYAPTIGSKHPLALGRPAREVWAELWDDLGPLLTSVASTGETVAAQDRPFHIDRAGFLEEVWFDISYSAVRGPEGAIDGVLCIVTETTGRVLANRRIADSEARLRRAVERIDLAHDAGAVLGTWVWDVMHNRVTGDERFVRTFGLPAEALDTGVPFEHAVRSIHPDDVARLQGEVRATLSQGGAFRAEYRVPHADGSWRWVEANGHVQIGGDGQAVRFPGVLVDIDRRRAAEETLRVSEARLQALAQALPTLVWTADDAGLFEWLNERVGEYTGRPVGGLVGSAWPALVHPDDLPSACAAWHAAVAGQQPFAAEFRMRRHDGGWRWHMARATPVTPAALAGQRHWVCACTDIQDQKAAQEALADLNASLERRVQERTHDLTETQENLRQLQKMEAVGQLTGGIAHDFNNMLGTIGNSLQMLRVRLMHGRSEDVERYLDLSEGAVRRAAALTHRLLAFSRRQTLDSRALDTNRLVRGMEDLIRRTAGPSIEVQVVGAPDLWATKADPSQLENSLLNLCINARDAMPDGGRLLIETANLAQAERRGGDAGLPAGEYVLLSVTDTGVGMPPEVVGRIFEPFYTTKPLGMGTGLGLSMVYGFARQSGGQVSVRSNPGEGTTICLSLPRHHGEPTEPQDLRSAPPASAPGGGQTIVLVEDEQGIRTIIEEVLSDAGYRVLCAENGPAGLQVLNAAPRVDLLITDVGLPGGLNGRQVADAARTQRPGLKVLFITGYVDNIAVGDGHLEPGMAVLTKPFDIGDLVARVAAMLGP